MLEIFKSREVSQVYAYEFLQKLAMGLISVFIPIYIASSGLNIYWALGFLVIESLAFMVSAIPSSYLIARIGFKHSMIFSYFFSIPALVSLQVLELSPGLVASSAILMALGKCFHYIALHSEFATDSSRDKRGKQTGRMIGLPRMARALAPAVGGAVLGGAGFGPLVGIAVLFLGLSAVPLTMSKDHRDPEPYSISALWDKKFAVFGSLFLLRGVGSAVGKYLFPIYVFLMFGGSFDAGAVKSLTSFGAMAFALFLGRLTEKAGRRQLIYFGAVGSGILFSLRAFVSSSIEAFIVSFAAGLVFMVYFIPVFSDQADIAEDEEVLEFYAFREVFLALGRALVVASALLMIYLRSAESLTASFHLAGVATILIALYAGWLERIR